MMEWLWEALEWFGRVSAVVVILAAIWRGFLWMRGVIPLSIRAGRVRKNTVAIFARSDRHNELLNSLNTTKLFNSKNFKQISTPDDLDACDGMNIFILNWEDWGSNIDQVLQKKTPKTGLIVYAIPGRIDQSDMEKLQAKSFVTVTNFRGRLITDLLTMALAIRYARNQD